MSASRARIQPLLRDEWGAGLRSAFDESTADRLLATGPDAPRMPNAFTMLMRHPALAGPFLAYNKLLLRTPAIEPRLRELMVLRVAFRTRSPYEWLQHVRLAPRWGITAAEIDAIADGTVAHPWSQSRPICSWRPTSSSTTTALTTRHGAASRNTSTSGT
jgi:alkylhydroperoxidase family enzyme